MSLNNDWIARNPELWKYLLEECTDENGTLMQEKIFPMKSKTLKQNNMKQNIEVDIPEGYCVDKTETEIGIDTRTVSVFIKKKKGKTFDFYVDEYLRSDYNTTNDMLCNWFNKDQLEKIGGNLKQNKLQFVPWEVKIGLLKFICNDIHIPWGEYIHQFNGSVYSSEIIAVTKIIPIGFRDEIIIN